MCNARIKWTIKLKSTFMWVLTAGGREHLMVHFNLIKDHLYVHMCMFACNGWGAIDGACVHAWAGQGAFACMQVGMHAAASAARTVHAGAFCFIFHDSSCPVLLALHFLSLAL
jgi:hypothetical protein